MGDENQALLVTALAEVRMVLLIRRRVGGIRRACGLGGACVLFSMHCVLYCAVLWFLLH